MQREKTTTDKSPVQAIFSFDLTSQSLVEGVERFYRSGEKFVIAILHAARLERFGIM